MTPSWNDNPEPVQLRTVRLEARRQRFRRVAAFVGVVAAIALVAGGGTYWWTGRSAATADTDSTSAATAAASGSASATAPGADASANPAAVTSSTSDATATAAADPQREIVIGWVGDTTPGSKYGNPPDRGRALYKSTRSLLQEPDIMVANLEGTFGKGGPSKCGKDSTNCYAFQAKPSNAAALTWAGIDVVNLANNHSHDYLAAGLKSTRKALKDNGVAYTGLTDTMAIKDIDGVKVAFVGFSPYNWSPDIGDIKQAKALVKEADSKADIVVVLMHAGAEGADKTRTPKGAERAYGEFRGDSRAFSHAVIDAGADAVLGSGPHVVRGVEEYKGRVIAYSLGNFAGWSNFSTSGKLALSGLLTLRMRPDGSVAGGKWHSLKIHEPGVPKTDKSKASLKLVKKLSKQDFESPVVFEKDGTFTLGQ